MSNGNAPNPLPWTQDDTEAFRAVFLKLLRSDLAVDSNVLQRFLSGMTAAYVGTHVLASATPATPPTVTTGAGAGTGATATLLTGRISNTRFGSGNFTGTVRLTTGTGCTANATLLTFTLGSDTVGGLVTLNPYARLVFFPFDKITRQASGPTQHPVQVAPTDGSGWAIQSNDTALADATTYTWIYVITA